MERSVVFIKPDGLQRRLVGEILNRIERKGLTLVGIKMIQLTTPLLEKHYKHLSDQPFFQELTDFMSSTPIVVTCWEGLDCVATVRQICGVTKAREAVPGTIRGDLAMSIQNNLVHASDTLENARNEVERFFGKEELFEYQMLDAPYIYGNHE